MQVQNPHLIIISAPSGAGKTTLCQKLIQDFSNLESSISATTRLPRKGERHGIEYFFISEEDFKKKIQAHEFAEWACVHSHYYGKLQSEIQKKFLKNKSVLLAIDTQGAEQLRKNYPNQTYEIFITPPSLQELEKRLRARGTDSEAIIQQRIRNAEIEMLEIKKFHAVVMNDQLDRAYAELVQILQAHFQEKIPVS